MIPGISACPFSCSLDLYYYASWLRDDETPQSPDEIDPRNARRDLQPPADQLPQNSAPPAYRVGQRPVTPCYE